jgi:hypothetical protein
MARQEIQPDQGQIVSRRDFLKIAGLTGASIGLAGGLGGLLSACGGKEETTTTAATDVPTTTTASTLAETTTTTAAKVEAGATMVGYEAAAEGADGWSLKNPDGKEISINLPNGFTPDSKLVIQTDLQMNGFKDFSAYENWNEVAEKAKIAGYYYGYNDVSQAADFGMNVQGDMFAWRVIQGQEVTVPGIGELKGDDRTSVFVLLLNLQPHVIPWDNDGLGQTRIKRGFTASGRIFDAGTPDRIAKTEEIVAGHYLFRQEAGTPENSYIGITDSPDNAKKTLFVSAAYRQWGNNPDGTPREQFQLLRAETVNFGK